MSQRTGNRTLKLWEDFSSKKPRDAEAISPKALTRDASPKPQQKGYSEDSAQVTKYIWGMLHSTCCFAMQDTSSGIILHCNLYQAAVILPALRACPFCLGVKRYQLLDSRGQKDNLSLVSPLLRLDLWAAAPAEPAFARFWHENNLFMGTGTHLSNRLCLHLWDFLQMFCSVYIVGVGALNNALRLSARFGSWKDTFLLSRSTSSSCLKI